MQVNILSPQDLGYFDHLWGLSNAEIYKRAY